MISLCAPSYDISGGLLLRDGIAAQQNVSRRTRRVPVLDLAVGAVLVDGGYSPADLTFKLSVPDPAGSAHTYISDLIATYQTAILGCSRGCYLVVLSNLRSDRGKTICTAEVLDDLGD